MSAEVVLCTHKTTILCQFGLIICHQFTNPYLNQFSSIFGGNYITFKAACVAMNLIENDKMWIDCMDEAMNLYTATSCTNLLIAILSENEVANPWGNS